MNERELPTISGGDPLAGAAREALERILPGYMRERRWFGGKARTIAATRVIDAVPLPYGESIAQIAFVHVEYDQGASETYVLPLVCGAGPAAERIAGDMPHAVIAQIETEEGEPGALLYDASADADFNRALLELIGADRRMHGADVELSGTSTQAFKSLRGADTAPPEPKVMRAEQSNTSVAYGDRLILKLFRRADAGTNPDLEIGRFLTERQSFGNIPPVAGALEYRRPGGEPSTLAILMGFVPNRGDAWAYTLEMLREYFARCAKAPATPEELPLSTGALLRLADRELPPEARQQIGDYIESAHLLGRRTAEMHLALAGDAGDPAFAPEPFGADDQRALYNAVHEQAERALKALGERLSELPDAAQDEARRILEQRAGIDERLRAIVDKPIDALRTRVHGDYHLGQVLYTGEDFFIIDFEGEPARPLSERRLKRSPLQDVAGMLRSFHYAPYAALLGQGGAEAQDFTALEPWARFWHRWVSVAFVRAYLETAAGAAFLPRDGEQLRILLDAYLLDKAFYELSYELNNRPSWTPIPLQGIRQLLETGE